MKGSEILVAMDEFRNTYNPFLLIFLLIIYATSAANDTINSTQTIRDGETLVSSGGIFELGFFSPGNSTNRYVGIWYHNISVRTYVWVANRQAPLSSNSGVLRFTEQGNLSLFNHTNGVIVWSTNATRALADPAAQLLDSGNLVVKDANDDRPENFVWQGLDYPSDTVLPTMGLGWDYVIGVESYLSSWRSIDDPSPGEFTFHVDPAGVPQVLLKRGGAVLKRMGPWNGLLFSGQANVSIGGPVYPLAIIREVVMNENEVKFRENMANRSIIFRAVLNYEGVGQTMIWNSGMQVWDNYSFLGADDCDNYDFCGANGICNTRNSQPCGCLDRFVSKDGCARRTPLNCRDDVFVKYPGIKMPDARNSTYTNRSMRLADCEAECSRNCSCTAYAQLDVRAEGSGCLFYHGELIDMRTMDQGGQDLYIRLASADLAADSKGNKRVILIASLTSVAGLVLVSLCLVRFCTRRRRKERDTTNYGPFGGNHGKEGELEFFNLPTILKATDSFSNNNKLGEGGFGPVYRGKLEDGQEIAVKRLSKSSLQGVEELKNEVVLIAKLQHRNLVRTLGFCVEGEENMLVYEYMPNFSLDLILFDRTKSMLLEWQQRFQIISGIAKGLLYLHQDSRLRIIHRDLKASNILLDAWMNPKISDFGLARGFGENETEAKTGRVVGTFGYMSPEYAIDGLFSMKSDVFSFGVLVLEIVSGQRNRGFSLKDHNLNLLGHAWTLYKEDRLDKLVDPSLGNSFDLFEVLRSIHVGLLCVQKRPEDRPSMSSVIFMLGNEVELSQAKEPGFFTDRDVSQSVSSSNTTHSGNQVTMTLPVGR